MLELPAEELLSLTVSASAGVSELLAGVKDAPHLGVDATAVQRSFSILVLQVHICSSGQKEPAYRAICYNYETWHNLQV